MLHLTHFQDVFLTPIHVVADPVGQETSLSITDQHHIIQVARFFPDSRVSFSPTPVAWKNLINFEEAFKFPLKPPYVFSQYFHRINLSPTSLGTSVLAFC